jgi:hypothetical protein
MQQSISMRSTSPMSTAFPMQRWIPLLVLLLGVQLALAAVLALRKDPLTALTPQTPLLADGVASADRVVIDASGSVQSVVLAKKNGQWVLPQYFDAPARATAIGTMLEQIAGLKRGLPLATSSAALKRFKLVDADFERRLTLSRDGKALGTLYVGSSAGVHKSYARTQADHATYSVDLAPYEIPTQSSDWLDTDVLRKDLGNLTEIEVTTDPHQSLQLVHHNAPATGGAAAKAAAAGGVAAGGAPAAGGASPSTDWTVADLPAGDQVDAGHVEALAREIEDLRVENVLGTQVRPEWQQDHPSLVLAMKSDRTPSATVTWTVAKPTSGDYYVLKSSQYPWYFQVDASSGKQLIDASAHSALVTTPSAAKPKVPEHSKATHSARR